MPKMKGFTMTDLNLNDVSSNLFILTQETVDKLFAMDSSDYFTLYSFYYKTAKWQKTNQVKANDVYLQKCLKWGTKRIRNAKNGLIEAGLIEIIQKRKDNKIDGWYIHVNYILKEETIKKRIKVESNKVQKQQDSKVTSREKQTNALSITDKCLKYNNEYIYSVFTHWNKSEIIKHRDINKFTKSIETALSHYSHNEIVTSIDNYSHILESSDFYLTHKYTLDVFLNKLDVFVEAKTAQNIYKLQKTRKSATDDGFEQFKAIFNN